MANIGQAYVVRDFFAKESITVGATSVGLTAATYAPGTLASPAEPASFCLITVETDEIRWYATGDAADSSGHLSGIGDIIELHGAAAVRNFRAIRVTANATIRVSYAR